MAVLSMIHDMYNKHLMLLAKNMQYFGFQNGNPSIGHFSRFHRISQRMRELNDHLLQSTTEETKKVLFVNHVST